MLWLFVGGCKLIFRMNDHPENQTPERRERIRRRRRALLWVLGITVLLLLAIIVSQQLWLWTVVRPDTSADALVLYALSTLNFVAFFVFTFIFVRNLLKLRRERKERQLGSKVKTRLLVYFISISFLPITAMAVFSYLFLNRSLEKWFYVLPDEILQQASELRSETLANQQQALHPRLVQSLHGACHGKESLAGARGPDAEGQVVGADGFDVLLLRGALGPDALYLLGAWQRARLRHPPSCGLTG